MTLQVPHADRSGETSGWTTDGGYNFVRPERAR